MTKSTLQRYMKHVLDMEDLSLQDILTKYTWIKSE
jgi:hypothetical protein